MSESNDHTARLAGSNDPEYSPQKRHQEQIDKLVEMGEQRQKALLEEKVRQLREKLVDTERLLERARDEAITAQERTRSADADAEKAKQHLSRLKIEGDHAHTLLQQELVTVTALLCTQRTQAESREAELEGMLESTRHDINMAQLECAERRAEAEELRAEIHSQKETHWTNSQVLERKWQTTVAEHKESFAKAKQALLLANDRAREGVAEAYKEEIGAYTRQIDALSLRAQETDAVVVNKEREIAELMEAIEELELEKRSEVQHIETQRQVEKRRLQQQQKEKIGQVETRYQREQHALRSFVFTTAKSMLSHVNMERALKKVDLYSSDSDSE